MANELSGIIQQLTNQVREVSGNFFSFRDEAKKNDDSLFNITKDAFNTIKNNKRIIEDVRQDVQELRNDHSETQRIAYDVKSNLDTVMKNQTAISRKVDQFNTSLGKFRKDVDIKINSVRNTVEDMFMQQRRAAMTTEPPTQEFVIPRSASDTMRQSYYDRFGDVRGGGVNGQAGAVSLAIAKAMVNVDPEYKKSLRDKGLMTRDARMVERKKPGQKKARKKFQFSKR